MGIPLPGTGAWTGTLIAFVLNMPVRDAVAGLLAGILMAASIVTALCELGWVGAIIAAVALSVVAVTGIVKALQSSPESSVRLESGPSGEMGTESKSIVGNEESQN